jgi:hypothetical protein
MLCTPLRRPHPPLFSLPTPQTAARAHPRPRGGRPPVRPSPRSPGAGLCGRGTRRRGACPVWRKERREKTRRRRSSSPSPRAAPLAPAAPPAAARARRITCGVRAPVPPHAAGALRPRMTPQGAGPAAAAPADPGRNRRLGGAARRRPALLLPRAFVARGFAPPRHTPSDRRFPCFPWSAPPARRAPHPCGTRWGCRAGRPPPRRPAGTFLPAGGLKKEATQFQPGTRPHLEVPPQVVPTHAGPRALQRANLHLWWARRRAAGVPPPPLRGTGTRPPGSVAHRTTAGVVSPPWSTLDALGRGRRASGPAMCAGEVASSPFRHRREAAAAAALRSVVKRGARRGSTA